MATTTRHKAHTFIEKYLIAFILLVFVLFRLNDLSLPYYWDEAWSYARAIINMSQEGLTIMPGSTDVDLTRGHPLMFYFLSALWMKIAGTGLIINHIFPLAISVLLLLFFFIFCKKQFGTMTAYLAVLLLAGQQIFLAQSTMLLPEIFLALLSVISVFAYFQRRWILFTLSITLVVLTKESGLVLASVFLFDHFIISLFFRNTRKRSEIFSIRILYLLIPFIFFGTFIIIQKARTGWYFFPEHIDMIKTSFTDVIASFRKCSVPLIFENGRFILLLSGITAFFFSFNKIQKDPEKSRVLIFSFLFIVFYIAFCSFNFFSTRYLMSILPFSIAICAFLITEALKENKVLSLVCALLLVLGTLAFTLFTGENESDVSLSYRNSVLLHKETVKYCEDNHWQNKKICGNLLMMYNLTEPRLGYLENQSEIFPDICLLPDSTTDIVIVCSNDTLPYYTSVKTNLRYRLKEKLQKNQAWVEIYEQK